MVASRDLPEELRRSVDVAEARWPTFRQRRVDFEQRLLCILSREGGDPCESLAKLHVSDLYIAHACASRIPGAVEAFEKTYLAGLDGDLQRFKAARVLGEDVRRELEDTLLLGPAGTLPRIAQYEGRGPLRRFVSAAARNAALSLLRRQSHRANVDVDAIGSQLTSPPDSGRRMASRHDAAVRDALRACLSALDRRQRMIVRLHLSQGVALTQIARMLGVHQSTVSRALDAALQRLYAGIRRELREVHGLEDAEMESIVRDVRSNLDLSLSRVLRDTGAG